MSLMRIIVLFVCGYSLPGFAQENLPKGIGAFGYGARHYGAQTHNYNEDGERVSLGGKFSHDFNGNTLLEGVGGGDLKKIAQQIKKFDANSNGKSSLLNSLNLGRLDMNVKGNINVQVLGIGFGILDKLTAFVVVPWATAKVNVDVEYTNRNNVAEIKERLGDLAFQELQSGLTKASQISTEKILDSITELGYADMRNWEYTGLGDIVAGTQFTTTQRWTRHLQFANSWTVNLSIPTGFYDDPDALNDVNIGRGYYVLNTKFSPSFIVAKSTIFGVWGSYGYGLPTQVDKRVPEGDEALVAPERTSSVTLTPGADISYGARIGYKLPYITPTYSLGVAQHTLDYYSGSMQGNYDALAKGSDSYELFHEIGFSFSTAEAYQQKKFPLPLVGVLEVHLPIAARNTLDNRYVQLGFASFFKTPLASTTAKTLAKNPAKSSKSKLAERRKLRRGNIAH